MQAQSGSIARDGDVHQTERLAAFVVDLQWNHLPQDVRHAAKRHLLDTVGVMIRGGGTDMPSRLGTILANGRTGGTVPVPGRARRADMLDAAYIGGTGGHGLELDDGYRLGSIHPGVAVVPPVIACAYGRGVDGKALLEAIIAGYETIAAISRAAHPALRQRGFHATGTVGTLGSAAAAGKLRGLDHDALIRALGIAASASSGLFAFLGGGGDVKRLHAGHAAREGLMAALLAEDGMGGPAQILETRDGFGQAFAGEMKPIVLPPETGFGITDCYIKPYACCRHLQPAAEALMHLRQAHSLDPDAVRRITVETYSIAAEHAHVGWGDFATAQLSFPYIMALALRYGDVALEHFEPAVRTDASLAAIAGRVTIRATPEMDARYPEQRPARITLDTAAGSFVHDVPESLGSRQVPFEDDGVSRKFVGLVAPVLGEETAHTLLDSLWTIDTCPDVTPLLEMCALQSPAA